MRRRARGWRFGNTINGAWAEFLLVPDARANLAPIPDGLTDEQVMLLPDIFSTGLSGAESGNIRVGDAVAIFAQGPIGLCATLGAHLRAPRLSSAWTPIQDGWTWPAASAPTSRSIRATMIQSPRSSASQQQAGVLKVALHPAGVRAAEQLVGASAIDGEC